MKSEIRHRPSFSTLFTSIPPGETVVAESDAMASMTPNTRVLARFNGGFFRALLLRIFGGESLFVNFFSSKTAEPAEVVFTQNTPGDMCEAELEGETLYLQPGAFVACTSTLSVGVGWAGFASWIGGEGLFRLKVSGHGKVWIGAYGSVYWKTIEREYVVDTSHLVAYDPSVSLKAGLAGGIFTSFFSGEGLVTRVHGPGRILLQSRSMDGLASWTNGHLY